MNYERLIAQALLEKGPESREETADRFRLALAELKEDPRWKVLEERTLARLAAIVRDLIYNAGEPTISCELAGEARCLLDMLAAPIRAIRSLTAEKQDGQEQGSEDFERFREPQGGPLPGW